MHLGSHDIEANSKETYARHLSRHVVPYIGKQRVAEVSRETIHRLLTVVLKEEGASQATILHTRTALSSMMQMAWDNGYRKDNPVRGIRLKGVPAKPIIVATKDQFRRVYKALPSRPAKLLARLGVSTGARLCELISFIPDDFDFDADMLDVRRSTVEVTSRYHPTGDRFLTREHTDELPNGRRYKHGTLGGYMTAQCRCAGCKQWSADYGRDRKRRRTGRSAREWSPAWRSDPTEYLGADVWRRIWNTAVDEAGLPFRYTPYQVRHTHASWLIDQGVDLARVQYRLGHGDLQATTRYVKVIDEEDPKAAEVMSAMLGDVA